MYKNDNSGYLTFGVIALCNSNTLWNILMVFGRNIEQTSIRMTTLPFILLVFSPFVIFDSDYALILCPLCILNKLWNIFMILDINVEQDETMSHTRMTTLAFLLCFVF